MPAGGSGQEGLEKGTEEADECNNIRLAVVRKRKEETECNNIRLVVVRKGKEETDECNNIRLIVVRKDLKWDRRGRDRRVQ